MIHAWAGAYAPVRWRFQSCLGTGAYQAFPPAVQFPGAPHPLLPFPVDGISFGKNVLPAEAEWFFRQGEPENPGGDSAVAGVRVD